MEVFTLGFTKKSAAKFFEILRRNGIKRLIDVRLNNVSQLAGFTKKEDLEFFLQEICGAEYIHQPLLAPTKEMLDAYKKGDETWDEYAKRFLDLMATRRIEEEIDKQLFSEPAIMLCSEPTAKHCHRRLVAEYLKERWGDFEIRHV